MKLIQRVRSALTANGVLDGLWSIATTAGAKAQTLVAIAVSARYYGLDGLTTVLIASATSAIGYALIDWGVSTQALRGFAVGDYKTRTALLGPIFRRALFAPPVVAIVAFIAWPSGIELTPTWVALLLLYSVGMLSSITLTQACMGQQLFRRTPMVTGIVRSVSGPAMFAAAAAGMPIHVLVLILALSEWIIAAIQYVALPSVHVRHSREPSLFLVNTWKFGVGNVLNVISNKSDVALVSVAAGSTAVGVYGVASQLQNAIAVAALVPAGALTTYAARADDQRSIRRQRAIVGVSVLVAYVALAAPFAIWPSELAQLIVGGARTSDAAIRICLAAGLFSCLAGVSMMQLVGQGAQNVTAVIWLVVALVAAAGLTIGASQWGAEGASLGALLRDAIFFLSTWTVGARMVRGRERGAPATSAAT